MNQNIYIISSNYRSIFNIAGIEEEIITSSLCCFLTEGRSLTAEILLVARAYHIFQNAKMLVHNFT